MNVKRFIERKELTINGYTLGTVRMFPEGVYMDHNTNVDYVRLQELVYNMGTHVLDHEDEDLGHCVLWKRVENGHTIYQYYSELVEYYAPTQEDMEYFLKNYCTFTDINQVL